ncbi:hypothetical protein [Duganella vulcania]|uniref:Uncharacterized protein n=1 Tax=Duganella vulcania TaxID=2692166 RepID=A0A845GFS6_9BURK|nr:hypothetical protein [Duganella vulcania]MYM92360.1 hypothetical protein [Duganella vulcania]
MISRQIVIDALKASDHIITQHNLMSTASQQDVAATLNRLFDWRNGVVHLVNEALACEGDTKALRQVLQDAEQMSPILTQTMERPFLDVRQTIIEELRAALAAPTAAPPAVGHDQQLAAR